VTDEVFIDSGAFIAFLVRSDRQHQEVVTLFARPPSRWCTSVLVVSETYSWFLHRSGEEPARTFQRFLKEIPKLRVLGASDEHREAVWEKLDKLRGAKLTFVDASSLVWIEKRNIRTVWGTDHHLALEGAKVVPGPPAG
jgi:predicted nucleic acid-binding protein